MNERWTVCESVDFDEKWVTRLVTALNGFLPNHAEV